MFSFQCLHCVLFNVFITKYNKDIKKKNKIQFVSSSCQCFSLQVNTFKRYQFGHLRCSVPFFKSEKKSLSLANNVIGFYLNIVFHVKLSNVLL